MANLQDFLDHIRQGKPVIPGTELQRFMIERALEVQKLTAELNGGFTTPEERQSLLEQITGKPVDPSVGLFPPFTADFGLNITLGKNVFINSGCRFQDQGGITIGDGSLIGHNVVLATLNHDLAPSRRKDVIPAPIAIGANVWIGANATVLPGITIGDNAVVAAGAVVTKDVPANVVVGGVPARVLRTIDAE